MSSPFFLFKDRNKPDFAWDFRCGSLPPGSTFTRASGATVFDRDGVLKWAPENLVIQSQTFDNAAWTKAAGGTGSVPVVTANDALAPDGTLTADKVVFNAGAGTTTSDQSLITSTSITVTPGARTIRRSL